ncbi:MAG: hypothetical protein EAX95_10045 [Candidatus Thorarchaeota archaeon]|nr:hypothetical protein [Candidatus Thorarchaeota archaeon]
MIGEGKKRLLRTKERQENLGFGGWYAFHINTKLRLTEYFWMLFQLPYVVMYSLSVLFYPSLLSNVLITILPGVFLSTLGAFVTASGLHSTYGLPNSAEAHL